MPEPVRGNQRYLPGLDGIRALAVLAVIAYHLQLGWAPGGLLGVGVFFTLSGYLITNLLLGQRQDTGRLQLGDFWLRRARRLLPALFVMLAVVVGWVALLDRAQLPGVRGTAVASAGYISNWWLIAQHASYFARFSPPSPLGHLWSLAVEEQFYVFWPWLLWAGLLWTRRRRAGRRRAGGQGGLSADRRRLAAASLLLAAASAVAMAVLYHPGYDPTRVYDGTDTRAFGLLIGAALAFVWPSRGLRANTSAGRRLALEGAGVTGLVVIALLVWRTGQYSPFLYRGGMVVLSLAAAAVVLAAASPATSVGRVLGWRPLRWLGVRSYGIYLWHYPIIMLTTPANGRETVLRGAAQTGASIVVAALSWRYVEEPIRRGAIGRIWGQLTSGGWRGIGRRSRAAIATAGAGAAVAGISLAGVVPAASAGPSVAAAVTSDAGAGVHGGAVGPGGSTPAAASAGRGGATRLRTSCRSVVHIGDSTSDGLVLPAYQPDPALRIAAQYRRVGVTRFVPEVSGARSIVETWHGFPNAYTVAQQLIRQGYHGCWVLALGTNDTADVAVGSNVGLPARIRQMMSLLGGRPVMWVNVISLLSSGPYAESNMRRWDRALLRACPRYPSMRVYDWAAAARRNWFIPDGIHYTPAGYAARSRLIAGALALAFPRGRGGQVHSLRPPWLGAPPGASFRPSCLVS